MALGERRTWKRGLRLFPSPVWPVAVAVLLLLSPTHHQQHYHATPLTTLILPIILSTRLRLAVPAIGLHTFCRPFFPFRPDAPSSHRRACQPVRLPK